MATILDVAARAGVGVGTVSRVLNESPAVSETTRQVVLTAIDDLGYRPSSLARNLSLGRTSSVFVVLPDLNRPAVGTRLRGVLEALSLTGLDPVVLEVGDEDQGRDRFRRVAERGRAEGAVVIDLRPSTGRERISPAGRRPVRVRRVGRWRAGQRRGPRRHGEQGSPPSICSVSGTATSPTWESRSLPVPLPGGSGDSPLP